MAEGGCPFPPWDPRTEEESGLFDFSPYRDLLRRNCVELRDKLQVSKLWVHLRRLKVLRQNDEERIRVGVLVFFHVLSLMVLSPKPVLSLKSVLHSTSVFALAFSFRFCGQ